MPAAHANDSARVAKEGVSGTQRVADGAATLPRVRRLQRQLVGHAQDVEMDGHGRILVPAALREYAGIEKQAVLVGQGRKFELWDEERWNAEREAWQAEAEHGDPAAALESLSL